MRGNSDPSGALLLGIGAGIFLFFKGFRTFREYKVISDTPRIRIRSMAMGLVNIRGKAQSDQLIPSPVTHTPCCFYKVVIDRWHSGSDDSGWKHYRTDLDGTKFYLQDDTAKVLIDSYSAEYDLPESAPRIVDSARISSLAGSGPSDNDLLTYVHSAGVNRATHIVEHFLEKRGPLPDEHKEQMRQSMLSMLQAIPNLARSQGQGSIPIPVDLIQKAIAARGPLADPAKEQQRQMFLQHLQEHQTLPISIQTNLQRPSDGRYRLREYLVLPGQEYDVTGSCMPNPTPKDPHDNNLIAQGQNEKTFLISCKSAEQTRAAVGKRSAGMIFGGAALAVVCLVLLLFHLKML
jgi:hypothetical protein